MILHFDFLFYQVIFPVYLMDESPAKLQVQCLPLLNKHAKVSGCPGKARRGEK